MRRIFLGNNRWLNIVLGPPNLFQFIETIKSTHISDRTLINAFVNIYFVWKRNPTGEIKLKSRSRKKYKVEVVRK